MKKKEREGSGIRQEESLQQVFDSNENSIHDVYVSTPSLPDAWHLFPKDDPQQQRKLKGWPVQRISEREKETEGRESSKGANNNSPWGSSRVGKTTSGSPRFRQFEHELVGPQSSPSRVQYEIRRKCKHQSYENQVSCSRELCENR